MRAFISCTALAAVVVGCGGVDAVEDDGEDGSGGAAATGATSGDPASTGSGPAGPASSSSSSSVSTSSTGAGAGSSVSTGGGGSGDGGSGVGGSGDGGSGVGGNGSGAGSGTGGASCDPECGPEELCDGLNRGFDDDCDGDVDEGCPCTPGTTSSCFEGDPTYLDVNGCFAGTMACDDDETWGACIGGAHPVGGASCVDDESGCHPISAWPYQQIDLHAGTGAFGSGVDPDDEVFEVDCPAGVVCPDLLGADSFQGFQGGRYEVTYTKFEDGDPVSCTFPLDVTSRGLRVELSWNYAAGADLDLHMMQPEVATAFSPGGSPQDCTWDNCRIDNGFPTPEWFALSAPEGDPVAWFRDDDPGLNSCYFAPRGFGEQWSNFGQGCHNPRLDVDNITCSTAITDPSDPQFCASENINVDFPPMGEWMRFAAIHYSGATAQPEMRFFCDGELVAELGAQGYQTPVSLVGSAGLGEQPVWIAADVAYVSDGCGGRQCVVSPIYLDNTEAPWVIANAPAGGPPLPPPP